jgi:hypothetical protein
VHRFCGRCLSSRQLDIAGAGNLKVSLIHKERPCGTVSWRSLKVRSRRRFAGLCRSACTWLTRGKNRVAFLRQEGVSHYSALTTPYDYPAPDRLKLIQVAGTHGEEWWAVLDDDLIEPLRHPEWTVPVLSAYGVLITKQWPAEYASCASVRAKIVADDLGYSPPLGRPAISIKAMKMKELRDAEHTSASLLELENIQFRQGWRRVVLALIGIIAVVVNCPSAISSRSISFSRSVSEL